MRNPLAIVGAIAGLFESRCAICGERHATRCSSCVEEAVRASTIPRAEALVCTECDRVFARPAGAAPSCPCCGGTRSDPIPVMEGVVGSFARPRFRLVGQHDVHRLSAKPPRRVRRL